MQLNKTSFNTKQQLLSDWNAYVTNHITRTLRVLRDVQENSDSAVPAASNPDALVEQISQMLIDTTFSAKKMPDTNGPAPRKISWILYYTEQLELAKKKKDIHVADDVKAIAQKWKKMSKAELKPYLDEEKKDRKRYNKELKEYNARIQSEGDNGILHTNVLRKLTKCMQDEEYHLTKWAVPFILKWDEQRAKENLPRDDAALEAAMHVAFIGEDATGYVEKKQKADPNRMSSPMNSWQLFCQEQRLNDQANKVPFTNMSAASKRYSERWKSLSPEEKEPYNEKAKLVKQQYLDKMAVINDHVYQLIEVEGTGCANAIQHRSGGSSTSSVGSSSFVDGSSDDTTVSASVAATNASVSETTNGNTVVTS